MPAELPSLQNERAIPPDLGPAGPGLERPRSLPLLSAWVRDLVISLAISAFIIIFH